MDAYLQVTKLMAPADAYGTFRFTSDRVSKLFLQYWLWFLLSTCMYATVIISVVNSDAGLDSGSTSSGLRQNSTLRTSVLLTVLVPILTAAAVEVQKRCAKSCSGHLRRVKPRFLLTHTVNELCPVTFLTSIQIPKNSSANRHALVRWINA